MIIAGIIAGRTSRKNVYNVVLSLFDQLEESNKSNRIEAICITPPGMVVDYKANDVVLVDFENNEYAKPIILGSVYKQPNGTDSTTDINSGSIYVKSYAQLPENTSIGNISKEKISYIKNLSSDAQTQLNVLDNKCSHIVKVEVSGNSLVIKNIAQ